MTRTLADRFDEAKGAPIDYSGRSLHKSLKLPVSTGDSLELRFLRSSDRPVQGVGLKCENCRVKIAGIVAASAALWRETASDHVAIDIVNARNAAQLILFNQWRDEKHGSTMYHLNNAAMEIVEQPDAALLLRCSDGWGEPDFQDLVVELRVKTAR